MELIRPVKSIFMILIFWSIHPAFGRTPDEIRAEIKAQASMRHPDESSRFWTELGAEALPVIKQMYQEPASIVERTWLIDGLAHFNDPEVGVLLQGGIKSDENPVMKKKLLSALIQSQGESAFEFAEPYLRDADPHIRLAVAQGLKNVAVSEKVLRRLKQFQAEEKTDWVKALDGGKRPEAGNTLKRAAQFSSLNPGSAKKTLDPLSEKDWGGEWYGAYLTPSKVTAAEVILTRQERGWRVELRLPKQSKIELKTSDVEVSGFSTDHLHWIQVKSKKDDFVFTGKRKSKP
jgi:hypothetical protein